MGKGSGVDRDHSIGAPEQLRATRFESGGDEFAVLSFPVTSWQLPDDLTAAERAVCQHLVAGATNEQIAAARGTAVRTVANQVAAILRKLGVSARHEVVGSLITSRVGGHDGS